MTEEMPRKARRPNKGMTDKQKAARLENLAKGRARRMEKIKMRKLHNDDDLLDDSADESEEDVTDFVLTKKSKKKEPKEDDKDSYQIKDEIREVKEALEKLAAVQKKPKKKRPQIIYVPREETPVPVKGPEKNTNTKADLLLDALRRSLI